MALLHIKHPLLTYASKPNIVYPKEGVPNIGPASQVAALNPVDFPSSAVAASATAVQATHADHSAKTRIQTEP